MISFVFTLKIFYSESYRKKLRSKQIEQIKTSEDIQNHIIYVINKILTNKILSQLQFLQYVLFNHQKLCQSSDCSLKKLNIEELKVNKVEKNNQLTLVNYVKLYIKEVLKKAIEVYPEDQFLKLLNLNFHFEILEEHIETYSKIQKLRSIKTSLEVQYIIYFLEEEMFQQNILIKDQQDEKDVQTTIFSKKIIQKKFDIKVEQIVYYYLDFWTLLKQDLPDLDKIMKFGKRIILLKDELEKIIQSLDSKTQQDIQILYNYCVFIKEIVKDQQKVDKIMDIVRCQLEENCQQESNNTKWLQNMDLNQQPYPIAVLSFDKKKQTLEIVTTNDAFQNLFQFSKEQIQSKFFDDIIPNIYKDQYLKYLKEQISVSKSYIKKQHFFFFVDKQQYLVPVICKILPVENKLQQEMKVFLQMHYNQEFDESAFVLLSEDLKIQNITFNCKNILGIQKISYYQNPSIENWCQGISQYLKVQDKPYKTKAEFKLIASQYSRPQCEEQQFFLQVQSFCFEKDNFLALKINRIEQENIYNICNIQQQIFDQYSFKNGMFKKINKLKLQQSKRNESFNNAQSKNFAGLEDDVKEKSENDYQFKGIKILKLKNNKLYEIDYEQKDTQNISIILQEERQKFNLEFVHNDINLKQVDNQDSNSIDSKQKFLTFLKNINYNSDVFYLKMIFHILIFITITNTIINMYMINQKVDRISSCKQYNYYTDQKNINFSYISHQIQYNILYYSYFTDNKLQEKQFDTYIEKNLNDRMLSINNIRDYQRNKELNYLDLEEKVNVATKMFQNQKKTITALEEALLGKVVDFLQYQNVTMKQKNIIYSYDNYFVIQNVQFQLQRGYANIKEKIKNIEQENIKKLIVISIIQSALIGFFSVIFYVYFIRVFKKILNYNQQFMNCFLKIPEEFLNRRIEQIQQYQQELIKNNGQEDDTRTLTFTNVSKQVKNTYQRKKKFKNQKQLFSSLLVGLSLYFFALILTYILLICILQTTKIKNRVRNFEKFELQNRTELGTMIDFSYLTNKIMNIEVQMYQQQSLNLQLETFPHTLNFVSSFFYQFYKSNTCTQQLIDQIEISYLNFTCHNDLVYRNETAVNDCTQDFNRVQLTGMAYIMNYILDLMNVLQNNLKKLKFDKQFVDFYHELSYWTNTHVSFNFQNLTNLLQNYNLQELNSLKNISIYVNIFFMITVVSYYLMFMIFIQKKLVNRLDETKQIIQIIPFQILKKLENLQKFFGDLDKGKFK